MRKDDTIYFKKSSNPLTQPKVDENGIIFADPGPNHYVIAFEKTGPRRAGSSNATWSMHQFAEDLAILFSLDALVIREDTHQAVAFYKGDEGYQENWEEKDPLNKAKERRRLFGRL